MEKVLIIQNKIPKYREALFSELGKILSLTIIHSGEKISGDLSYREIVVSKLSYKNFFLQKGLVRIISQNKFDVIILMFDLHWICNVILPLFKPCRNVKWILWGHRYNKNKFINLFRNFMMKRVDANILYSDHEIPRMVKNGIKRESIFVANNTLDVPNSVDLSLNNKDCYLYVGRLQKRKRIDELIIAFKAILPFIPEHVNLEIIGDGEEMENLFSLVEKEKIGSRVIFRGEITDSEQLINFFSRAFLYISIGAVGLSVLHSFAYGIPVVTIVDEQNYHGPELYNIINNENSFLIKNLELLPKLLIDIANYRIDNFSDIGQKAFRHFTENRTIDKMVLSFKAAVKYSMLQ
ncbi:MAG: glycosyltransferase family 4 protein [Saprospiraceae bacterium]|nr:glycosyltransferase family 4 protein [Saprospiraceae bacterium]